jgi:hypothetical protein
MKHVLYTGHFVDDQQALLQAIPVRLAGEGVTVYAHHVTDAFRPEYGAAHVDFGRRRTLLAIGQVVTERVHAVLVTSPDEETISTFPHPHITMATAEGVHPKESNEALAAAASDGTIEPIEPPVPVAVTEGYCDGTSVYFTPQ